MVFQYFPCLFQSLWKWMKMTKNIILRHFCNFLSIFWTEDEILLSQILLNKMEENDQKLFFGFFSILLENKL